MGIRGAILVPRPLHCALTGRSPAAVICPGPGSGHPDNSSVVVHANNTGLQQFEKWWDKSRTVPFYLIGLLLPLLNFRSPSFFSKFNILGEPRPSAEPPAAGGHYGRRQREPRSGPVPPCLICSCFRYPASGFSWGSLAQRKL